MKKILTIGWKDLVVAFRDRAVIIMLAAPFVLTLAMGLVTGSFSDNESGFEQIPVGLVNYDRGELGAAMATWLRDRSMRDLLGVTIYNNDEDARQAILQDEIVVAILVQPGFSEALLRTAEGSIEDSQIELHINPAQPIRASIVESLIQRFVRQIETGVVGSQVTVAALMQEGLVQPQEAYALGWEIGGRMAAQGETLSLINIDRGDEASESTEFNPLALIAPSMAVLFLMYTVTSVGGRSILSERDEGTLPRMLSTPSNTAQILGGKVIGVLFVGIAQMGILILASNLIFQLKWGDPLAIAVLIITSVIGASGWGILLAAVAKTPAQVSSVGTAIMLLFGILAGSFFGGTGFEGILGAITKITPNAWAQEGFLKLAEGGGLVDIVEYAGALVLMGVVLFSVAVTVFRRRGLTRG